jgi:methyl-accepting chemotaxis protein
MFKNATNSNVFMNNRINDLLEFGIGPSVKAITESLTELESFKQDKPELTDPLADLKKRLEASQLITANMIALKNVSLKAQFDEKGLGFAAMPLIKQVNEAFSGDFFNQALAQNLERGFDGYFETFGDLRDTLTTMTLNNQSLSEISERSNRVLLTIVSDLQSQTIQSLTDLEVFSYQLAKWLLIVGLIGIFILFLFNLLISRSIIKPLKNMQQQLVDVVASGDLKNWQTLTGRHEIAEMSQAQAALLDSVSLALNEVDKVNQALAQGNTQMRITGNYQGDLKTLSNAVNESLETVEHTLNQIDAVSQALAEGNLSVEVPLDNSEGQFRRVLESMTHALNVQQSAINDVRRVTRAMRSGEFEQRVEIDMPGELHNLKRYLNESLERLEQAISNKAISLQAFSQGDFSHQSSHQFEGKLQELNNHMNNMAQSVSHMLEDVKNATEHAVNGIKEISSGNQDLNQRVQKQAIALQNTSANMSIMLGAIRETLSESQLVGETTDKVQQDSSSGLEIVEKMVCAMNEIQNASQEIAQITGLIDSIAFQTNLLALNAAVEAARAGEAGRGFAVVATEVRSLAQRSAEAAHQIRGVVDSTLQTVAQGMSLSQQTQSVFEQNTNSIERVAKMIIKMTRALEQQNQGIHEVTQALSDIDESTQQNAALVEQIATTSSNIIEEVLGLEHKVSGFKLRDTRKIRAA